MGIQHMNFVCGIPKATDTHSDYVVLISFSCQQWLCKCVSVLRYTGRSRFMLGLCSWKTLHISNTMFPFKTVFPGS